MFELCAKYSPYFLFPLYLMIVLGYKDHYTQPNSLGRKRPAIYNYSNILIERNQSAESDFSNDKY